MIEKMKVVHIVAAASEKTALLDRLRYKIFLLVVVNNHKGTN